MHPFARQPSLVRLLAHRAGDLGREDPLVTVRADGLPDDLLRPAEIVLVGGVDEIHPGIEGLADDALGDRRVGAAAEHHRAETDLRHPKAARAEDAVFHLPLPSLDALPKLLR